MAVSCVGCMTVDWLVSTPTPAQASPLHLIIIVWPLRAPPIFSELGLPGYGDYINKCALNTPLTQNQAGFIFTVSIFQPGQALIENLSS